jgi:hypothetical protein
MCLFARGFPAGPQADFVILLHGKPSVPGRFAADNEGAWTGLE